MVVLTILLLEKKDPTLSSGMGGFLVQQPSSVKLDSLLQEVCISISQSLELCRNYKDQFQ